MLEYIDAYLQEVKQFQSSNKDEIEQFRIKFNGKKGILNAIFDEFKQVPNEQKRLLDKK